MKEHYKKITSKHYYSLPGFCPSALLPIPEEEDEEAVKPKKIRMYRNSQGQRVAQLSPKELYLREQYARMYGKKFNGKLLGPYAAARAAASKRTTGQGTGAGSVGYGNSSNNNDYDDDDDSSISDVLDDGDSDSMEYEESDSDDDYYGGAGGEASGEANGEVDGEADGNGKNNNGGDGSSQGSNDGSNNDNNINNNDASNNDASNNDASNNDASNNDASNNDASNNDASNNDASNNDASNNEQQQQQPNSSSSSRIIPLSSLSLPLTAKSDVPGDNIAVVFLTPKNLHEKLRLMQRAGWISARAKCLIVSLKHGTNSLYPIHEADEAGEGGGEGGGAVLFLPSEEGHQTSPVTASAAASYSAGSILGLDSSYGSPSTSHFNCHSKDNSATEAGSGNPMHQCCRTSQAEEQEHNSQPEVWQAHKRGWKGKAVVGVATQPDGDDEAWLDSFRERPAKWAI